MRSRSPAPGLAALARALLLAPLLAPCPASGQGPQSASVWEIPPRATSDGAFAVTARDMITLHELADAWAPVLWFSDHEPLLASGDRLPTRLSIDPPDPPQDMGVVYYRATVVHPRTGANLLARLGIETEATGSAAYVSGNPVPSCTGPRPDDPTPDCLYLGEIELIRLQYLFYFEKDVGGGGHSHDLEIAEMWFSIEPLSGGGYYQLRLEQVVGYAHGHKGLANKLDLGDDAPRDPLVLPITLLIERGKHAPAPDRTADGHFSPGFDVNRMVSDAWGVRDVFGSAWFGSRTYASWMTLGRTRGLKAWPPALKTQAAPPQSWSYELRDFAMASASAAQDLRPTDELFIYLDYHGYDVPPQNGGTHLFDFWENFGAGARIDLGLGPYVSWMSPELPYIGGHVVATGVAGITFVGNGAWYGASVLYSPSIAGFFNVYGGATWLQCPSCGSGKGFGPEAGIKFRLPIPHPPAPDFVGLRVGLRYDSFTGLTSPRLLLEIGLATP